VSERKRSGSSIQEKGWEGTGLRRFFGAGLAGGFGGSFGGGGIEDLVAKFAVGDFVESDVHEGHTGADSDHGAVAEAELADPLRDDIDEDLGVGDLGEGAMDKF
jgi:hypothetical protein